MVKQTKAGGWDERKSNSWLAGETPVALEDMFRHISSLQNLSETQTRSARWICEKGGCVNCVYCKQDSPSDLCVCVFLSVFHMCTMMHVSSPSIVEAFPWQNVVYLSVLQLYLGYAKGGTVYLNLTFYIPSIAYIVNLKCWQSVWRSIQLVQF